VALPATLGFDYFIAHWETALWANEYCLDVALDEGFENFLPGFENLVLVNDSLQKTVASLDTGTYFYRVRPGMQKERAPIQTL